MAVVVMKALPLTSDSMTVALYVGSVTVMGLLISWAAPACNNPIFAEIVTPDKRELVYAFDRCFEAAISAAAGEREGGQRGGKVRGSSGWQLVL